MWLAIAATSYRDVPCPYVCVSVCLSICVCLYVCLSVRLSVCPPCLPLGMLSRYTLYLTAGMGGCACLLVCLYVSYNKDHHELFNRYIKLGGVGMRLAIAVYRVRTCVCLHVCLSVRLSVCLLPCLP